MPALSRAVDFLNSLMRPPDPYLSLRFRVEIEGIEAGGFSEVTGLQAEIELFDYREGGVNEYMHRLAGPVRYPANLVLKHGLMDADKLWQWEQEMRRGNIKRTNVSIILMNAAGKDKWRWDFKDACPVKWSGPDLKAGTADIALETLELTHRGLMSSSGRK